MRKALTWLTCLTDFLSLHSSHVSWFGSGRGIDLSTRADCALLNRTSDNSRSYVLRVNGSVCINTNQLKKRGMFVVSVYAPTHSSSPEARDEFYRDSSRLLRSIHPTEAGFIAGDFTAQVACYSHRKQRSTHSGSFPAHTVHKNGTSAHLRRLHSVGLKVPSFWSTYVDSNHGLLRAPFCLCLVCGHTNIETTHPVRLLLDDNRWHEFLLEF